MSKVHLFNKPFDVLCQFKRLDDRSTLADFIKTQGIYPAGRLDQDSEGLLLLTDDGELQARISDPKHKLPKTYWVQVEGQVDEQALAQLRHGVTLNDGITRPAKARAIKKPDLWERTPPVRFRKNIPTSWLEITITEGRNRQVRRMTAAVGLPTLRLVRVRIGNWSLGNLQPGESEIQEVHLPAASRSRKNNPSLSRADSTSRKTNGTTNSSDRRHRR